MPQLALFDDPLERLGDRLDAIAALSDLVRHQAQDLVGTRRCANTPLGGHEIDHLADLELIAGHTVFYTPIAASMCPAL